MKLQDPKAKTELRRHQSVSLRQLSQRLRKESFINLLTSLLGHGVQLVFEPRASRVSRTLSRPLDLSSRSVDYSFLTSELDTEKQVTHLNAVDVQTKLGMTCVIAKKGRSRCAKAELKKFILEVGRTFGII